MRLSVYEDDKSFILATFLYPRFKVKWYNDATEVTKVKQVLLDATERLDQPSASTDMTSPPCKRTRIDEDDLFGFMDSATTAANARSSVTADEIDDYLSQTCTNRTSDPLNFWKLQEKNLPCLALLAEKYLCFPATSGPVERLFSIAGKVYRPDRCLLKDKTFEALMFVRCNAK